MDNLSRQQRRLTMSRIRSGDTLPERMIRSALHRRGYRFRKNVVSLPGTPDIVLPKHRTVVFVNGCFWHQHTNCVRAVMPKSNARYWTRKLRRNVEQDKTNRAMLISAGWKVITVWECEVRDDLESVISRIAEVLAKHSVPQD